MTFLFSDVEGSTQLLERYPDAIGMALGRHHELFETVMAEHDGMIFETVGDAVYAAFLEPRNAVAAAVAVQAALASEEWGEVQRLAVRIAIHTGEVTRRGSHYFGAALFRCARLQSIGHGEQTLLSSVSAALVSTSMPAHTTLVDLGRHRLKDLSAPEHVYMVKDPALRVDFPPLRSIDLHPNNLPVQISSFIGREKELADVATLLRQHRLVTVTGPGGSGKTRLALHVAAEIVDDYPDGTFFVDLASVRDAELVVPAVATTLGLREIPGEELEATLAKHLHEQRLLLVLDNLEQIAASSAGLIARLLGDAIGLRVLATSRVRLRVRGERAFSLLPLPTPDRGVGPSWSGNAAARLFVDRASEVAGRDVGAETDMDVVAEICRRLDGLPLAIELAAARCNVLSPTTLLERLTDALPILTNGPTDVPSRQQTLRATVAWSYELLDPALRTAFTETSVFEGGARLEAIEQVLTTNHVLDEIGALVDSSLLMREAGTDPRFRMLETVREFASGELAVIGRDAELRDRHAAYYRRLGGLAFQAMLGADPAEWSQRHLPDIANFRLALSWLEIADSGAFLALTHNLARFWDANGLLSEGRHWLDRALAAPGGSDDVRNAALRSAGVMAEHASDYRAATECYEELRRRLGVVGDDIAADGLRRGLAGISAARGQLAKARRALADVATGARARQDREGLGETLLNLALCDLDALRSAEAFDEASEAIGIYQDLEGAVGVATGRHHAARALHQQGRTAEALALAMEALGGFERAGHVAWTAYAHLNLAWIHLRRGSQSQAAHHACKALDVAVRGNDRNVQPRILEVFAALTELRGETGPSRAYRAAATKMRREARLVRSPADTSELRRYGRSRNTRSKRSAAASPEGAIAHALSACGSGVNDAAGPGR